MYDLVIVGGGPAGVAAAVYAARKRLKTALVTSEWGGQSNVSLDVQNWIGTKSLSGIELAKNLREHAEAYKGDALDILSPTEVASLEPADDKVTVVLKDGKRIEGRALLIASGARRRKLEVPGAKEFDQKGLTYCASCDGPLFADKDVAVIGGGNAGFETTLQLLAYCKSVTLLNRTETFRADEITVAAARAHKNMRILMNAAPTEVLGEKFVTGLKWKDGKTGKEETLSVEGVFVEIGLLPNTEWIGDAVAKNAIGQIIVDPKTQRAFTRPATGPDARRGESGARGVSENTTSATQRLRNEADGLVPAPRIWAAGDATNGLYHQNNIAAGDAVKALEDIYMSLRRN